MERARRESIRETGGGAQQDLGLSTQRPCCQLRRWVSAPGHAGRLGRRLSLRGACMRYLITGGAGFIGSHLAEHLISRGDTVTTLDTKPSRYKTGAYHVQGSV